MNAAAHRYAVLATNDHSNQEPNMTNQTRRAALAGEQVKR